MLSKKGRKDVLWQIHCEFPENPHIGGCLSNTVFGIMRRNLFVLSVRIPSTDKTAASSEQVINWQ